nr:MAG: hypothetical protein 3 [Leviviridae sp.]
MKIPTTLLHRVLLNEGLQVGLSIERDYKEICSRFKHEGWSFLTITLPNLSDVLERGLSSGLITRSCYQGFRPMSKRGSLPALLSGFFMRVFDRDGHLLDEPCIDSIRAIRQVARLFKKVELPCSSARQQAAYERYIQNDEGLKELGVEQVSSSCLWQSVIGLLWSDLEALSGRLYCFPGKFGSGATAEKRRFNDRHLVRQWPSRGEVTFPSDFHCTHDFQSGLGEIRYLDEEDEEPVRVVQVPKTLKTPRTISVEPSYMMLRQQSVAKPLMDWLEINPLTKPVRFTDQSVNRDLARVGSIDGRLATIDLSDASDLVSNDLVCSIFGRVCPTFLEFIQDSRSRRARMPDGTIRTLLKFASMGSALCFPVEAMVFYSIVVYSMLRQSGRAPSYSNVMKITKDVAVYGDDIIVPASMATGVMEDLETFGLRVNQNKSYYTGLFRESCGGDYYKGVDVTPAYVRQWDTSGSLRDVSTLASYVSLSNTFYTKGLWNAAQYVRDFVDSSRGFKFPRSRKPIGVLHYVSVAFSTGLRYSERYSGYLVRGIVLRTIDESDSPGELRGFMLRSFGVKSHEDCRATYRREDSRSLRGLLGSSRSDRSDIYLDGSLCITEHRPSPVSPFDGSSYRGDAFRKGDYAREDWATVLLRTTQSQSLYTSARPYALKSKRTWTPSPEGLIW